MPMKVRVLIRLWFAAGGSLIALTLPACSGGAAPETLGLGAAVPASPSRAARQALLVADAATNSVAILDDKYEQIGTISVGIKGPAGMWVDGKGNLYVANYRGKNVAEYAPSATSPTCTYAAGLRDPIGVTTDASGDVYVVDYDKGRSGYVDRYAQCSNAIETQYSVGGSPEGVAIDSSGDLFVDYNDGSNSQLEEFAAGSTTPTPLGATLTFAGGMIIDADGNLIACDQAPGYVDQIAPPYTDVTLEFNGFKDPLNIALSPDGKLLFVADPLAHDVRILRYPSGIVVRTLRNPHAFRTPVGVSATTGGYDH
jgi:DNA-binding beta-propeller fold protein YncE